MSGLTITNRQVQGIVIVDLDGKVALGETNSQLHEALRKLVSEGKKNVVLNLAKVSTIDSSGLGEIVAGYSTLSAAGGTLKLINMPTRVTDLMTITKLYTVFDIYETEAEGIASFEGASDQPLAEAKATSTLL
ncbi:MAG TPA: STAS domain-containing protein [Pyrinomonadaceae bacterium]|jgi:anti-sigma B factor antagonist|nr:STAS domain-containing protein [Pyrinomonadaceae bacterium]